MTSKLGCNPQPIAARQWHSGFLPGQFQGVEFSTSGAPVHYVENPAGVTGCTNVMSLKRSQPWNTIGSRRSTILTLSHESNSTNLLSGCRRVPQLADLSGETAETLALYGAEPGKATIEPIA